MIPWNIKYPTQNGEMINLDWIISEVKRLNQNMDDLEQRVLAAALAATKEYVDEEVSDLRTDFNNLSNEVANLRLYFDQKIVELQSQYDTFVRAVDNSIDRLVHRIESYEEYMREAIVGLNASMDVKIANNNVYILDKVAEGIVNVKVVNYFTGELVTVQDMFNTLAELHLDNPITYTEVASAAITYADLRDLNMTYTELAIKGKSFINP